MQKTKRAFKTVILGHHYEVPEYEVKKDVGIVETGKTVPMYLVRGSKVTANNIEPMRKGTLHEHYLTVMIEDLKFKDAEFPSKETACAITKLEEARMYLEEREKIREAQGVLGTYQPHKS